MPLQRVLRFGALVRLIRSRSPEPEILPPDGCAGEPLAEETSPHARNPYSRDVANAPRAGSGRPSIVVGALAPVR